MARCETAGGFQSCFLLQAAKSKHRNVKITAMNKKQDTRDVLTERTTVRYTADEYKKVKQKAREAGMSFSAFCRQMTIEGYVKAAPLPRNLDEVRLFKNLMLEYKTNFSRIGNYIKTGDPALYGEVQRVRDGIQSVIDNIRL